MPKKPSSNNSAGYRGLHVKVKTARGRKTSSTRWLQRQLNDPYVQRAKIEGYRSRAAFKLLEMNERFNLLKPNSTIIDLGAAPGGWLQIASKFAPHSTLIGLDLLAIDPIEHVQTLQCDFTSEEGYALLEQTLHGKKADIVMSDMAPHTCGHAATDHLRIMMMCELAFEFAKDHLNEGGHFIAKVFKGGAENTLLNDLKKHFKSVKHCKPESS